MGYHIIIPKESEGKIIFIHRYVEDARQLASMDEISKDTIVYEAPEPQKPMLLSEHPKIGSYAKAIFRIGAKGEDLFEQQAREKKFITERINQSKEDYKHYKGDSGEYCKRSDFIVRPGSIEVEVKCLTIYHRESDGKRCFYLSNNDIVGHSNMMKKTGDPVVVALYEQSNEKPDPDKLHMKSPDPDKLHMIEIKKIVDAKEKGLLESKDSSYAIPLDLTEDGFTLLDHLKSRPDKSGS